VTAVEEVSGCGSWGGGNPTAAATAGGAAGDRGCSKRPRDGTEATAAGKLSNPAGPSCKQQRLQQQQSKGGLSARGLAAWVQLAEVNDSGPLDMQERMRGDSCTTGTRNHGFVDLAFAAKASRHRAQGGALTLCRAAQGGGSSLEREDGRV
jgi:hypothetical protein